MATKQTAESKPQRTQGAQRGAEAEKPPALKVLAITRMHWPKAADLAHYYGRMEIGDDGQPTDRWLARSLTTVRLPYSMRCAWDRSRVIRKVRVHRQVARSLTQVLSRVLEQLGLEEVRALDLDLFAGCYALPAGARLAARHYGAALELAGGDLPEEVLALFAAAGWTYTLADKGRHRFEAVS